MTRDAQMAEVAPGAAPAISTMATVQADDQKRSALLRRRLKSSVSGSPKEQSGKWEYPSLFQAMEIAEAADKRMYFLLDDTSRPRRWIGEGSFIEGLSWWRGAVITTPVPEPLAFALEPYDEWSEDDDQYMGAIIETNPPLWRDDFIRALQDFGVHNFDLYKVAITDPDDGTVYTNYKAVNILGLVAAADMEKSLAAVEGGIPLIDVSFDKLVVDEKKIGGIKLFRLVESANAILVHESVRDYLLEKGFGTDVEFYNLDEVAI